MVTIGPITALGTIWYVECFSDCDAEILTQEVTAFLNQFEATYSRFLPDSAVSVLNRDRVLSEPSVELLELLQLGQHFYTVTSGTFNILIGDEMERAGYDSAYSFTAATPPAATTNPLFDLVLSDAVVEIKKGKLDLGGVGKGFCIDKLSRYLQGELGVTDFLINGGGDMYGTKEAGEGIEIKLAHPTEKKTVIGTTSLHHQGFAASSPFMRAWQDKATGESHNHLLTQNNIASYVVAPSATEADVWATTLALAPETVAPADVEALLVAGGGVMKKATALLCIPEIVYTKYYFLSYLYDYTRNC